MPVFGLTFLTMLSVPFWIAALDMGVTEAVAVPGEGGGGGEVEEVAADLVVDHVPGTVW